MSIYNIHAGHGNSGGLGCGAVGILDESAESRKVKDELIRLLGYYGGVTYDCTYQGNASQNAILNAIVNKCNQHTVDLDISIHLNSGRNDNQGDSLTGGVEVYGYNNDTKAVGDLICEKISEALGIRNRGYKLNPSLYFLKNTKSKAILIECCFVDDKDDADHWNPLTCASAIARALFSVYNPNGDVNSTNNSTSQQVVSIKKDLNVNTYYRVYANGKWYPEVKNLEDYAGDGKNAIRAIAIKVDQGSVKYRVHIKNGSWYPYVTGCDVTDALNGYAGDGRNDIDAVEVYYTTPSGYEYKKAKYRVSPLNATYFDWQTDNDTTNGMDGYTGAIGKSIGKFQISIE